MYVFFNMVSLSLNSAFGVMKWLWFEGEDISLMNGNSLIVDV